MGLRRVFLMDESDSSHPTVSVGRDFLLRSAPRTDSASLSDGEKGKDSFVETAERNVFFLSATNIYVFFKCIFVQWDEKLLRQHHWCLHDDAESQKKMLTKRVESHSVCLFTCLSVAAVISSNVVCGWATGLEATLRTNTRPGDTGKEKLPFFYLCPHQHQKTTATVHNLSIPSLLPR